MNSLNLSITQSYHLKSLLLACALMSLGTAVADTQEWHFKVFLDDSAIGHHSFRLKEQEGTQVLESQADFKVKFLFFNAYRYDHDNVETWEGNCLTSITSSTDDNGRSYSVKGMRQNGKFVIETQSDRATLPACPMSFAYWNPEMLDETRLLNSQTGEYLPVEIRHLGEEVITVAGQPARTNRYEITAKELRIQLWYAEDGHWVGLQSITQGGKRIRYQLTRGAKAAQISGAVS